MADINTINEQFRRAWENATVISGSAKEAIELLGEETARDWAEQWFLKGVGVESGTMSWPHESKYGK